MMIKYHKQRNYTKDDQDVDEMFSKNKIDESTAGGDTTAGYTAGNHEKKEINEPRKYTQDDQDNQDNEDNEDNQDN